MALMLFLAFLFLGDLVRGDDRQGYAMVPAWGGCVILGLSGFVAVWAVLLVPTLWACQREHCAPVWLLRQNISD